MPSADVWWSLHHPVIKGLVHFARIIAGAGELGCVVYRVRLSFWLVQVTFLLPCMLDV